MAPNPNARKRDPRLTELPIGKSFALIKTCATVRVYFSLTAVEGPSSA